MRTTHAATAAHIVITLCLAAPASAEVFKCPDAGGKHLFQDTPCTGGARQKVKPVTIDKTPGYQSRPGGYPSASSSDPMVGMGKNALIQALGTPTRTSTTTDYAGAEIESLMFTQRGKAIVAYLKNGFVFSTSTVEREWIGQTSPTQRKCPSATDIRNAETSAGSITITESERREKRWAVARMKACLPD